MCIRDSVEPAHDPVKPPLTGQEGGSLKTVELQHGTKAQPRGGDGVRLWQVMATRGRILGNINHARDCTAEVTVAREQQHGSIRTATTTTITCLLYTSPSPRDR